MTGVSILYCSCYMYRALWSPFYMLLNRYWPDCPYPIYLGTDGPLEEIRAQMGDARVLHYDSVADNTKNYIARIISYLESLSTKQVLFWYDDLFLSGPVQTAAVESAVARMNADPQIKIIKLSTRSVPFTGELDGTFQRAQPTDSYILNVQPSLVDREFLIEILREAPNTNGPSDYEISGTASAQRRPYTYLRSVEDLVPIVRDGGILCSGIIVDEVRPFLEREGITIPTDDRGCIYDSRNPALISTLNPQLKQQLRDRYHISV